SSGWTSRYALIVSALTPPNNTDTLSPLPPHIINLAPAADVSMAHPYEPWLRTAPPGGSSEDMNIPSWWDLHTGPGSWMDLQAGQGVGLPAGDGFKMEPLGPEMLQPERFSLEEPQDNAGSARPKSQRRSSSRGAGQANLKKSWHPQTMKNIERVWKAEQKHEAERKKIEELQKELKDERAREEITKFAQESGALKKKDDRLDWMYQGPAGQVSRDEYLLGRPIDKQITEQFEEPESGPSTQTGLLPGSIFNPSTPASTLDLAAKIREDPLFEIRKREEEKKREVLTNPVKMKKIKEMLRQNLEKEKKRKRKKEKRGDKEKRKEKKKHKRRSRSSSSEEEVHKKHGSHSKEKNGRTGRPNSQNIPGYGLQFPASQHHQSSAPSTHERRQERSRSRSPTRNGAENHSSHHSDRKVYHRAATPPKERYQRQRTHRSKQLSAEELERKRQEMMSFAKQRDEEREINVTRYKKQDEQEKERERGAKHVPHAGFIHNMKLESAASSSLEDRVKRNIHSIQRTTASLEKNFMKR
ncbi:hypothetical protein CRUP_037178, partial [Coryphaenoides rupestris]